MDNQDDVFALLENPATHGGRSVKRFDTHISSVFLAGETAYKVKRAVRFPFLDFSTLEQRHLACEMELECNRRFAPQIYREVVPITCEADGSLALAGNGNVVEWAVEMQRFDENRTLDHLADANAIDLDLADALGRMVAEMHDAAPAADGAAWVATLPKVIDDNERELRETPELFPSQRVSMLSADTRARLDRVRPLLLARAEQGFVRQGHGDLHLGNIVMIGDRPVPFDAIEFDPMIAAGDVLYDLAFLLMDLVERSLPRQANIVFNRYLTARKRIEDLDALATLPLFLSLRAAIRAKVMAARLQHLKSPERAGETHSARRYFDFACDLIKPPAPMLIAIGGLSGTGKSALAQSLAPDVAPVPGAVVLRSDVERKMLFGYPETEKLPADAYAADISARVYETLESKARKIVAAGHSVVVDAVFAKTAERRAMAAAAETSGASFHGLFLTADLQTRLARVGKRGPDASDATGKVVEEQEHYQLGALDWHTVDASRTREETLRNAKAALGLG